MFQLYQVWSAMNVMHYFCNFALPTVSFCDVEARMEYIRFSDGGVLAYFRLWNLGGLLLLRSKLFYCLQLPIHPMLEGGDPNAIWGS